MKTDYHQEGQRIIKDAAAHQLEWIARAKQEGKPVMYTTQYGTSHFFTVALNRIEDPRANDFHPSLRQHELVHRERSSDSLLTAQIAVHSVPDGSQRTLAEALCKAQYSVFYSPGLGYLNPHLVDSTNPNVMSAMRDRLQSGKKASAENRLSLDESIKALSANVMLGHTDHVTSLIQEVFDLYYDSSSGYFQGQFSPAHSNWDRTASMIRVLSLAGDERGEELYRKMEVQLTHDFRTDIFAELHPNVHYRAAAFAFMVEHFRSTSPVNLRETQAAILEYYQKEVQPTQIEVEQNNILIKFRKQQEDGSVKNLGTQGSIFSGVLFGNDPVSGYNAQRCRIGLALTGLGESPLRYYVP